MKNAIAVVGLGLQLPGAQNKQEYWDRLVQGRDLSSVVPAGRWAIPTENSQSTEPKPDKVRSLRGYFVAPSSFDGQGLALDLPWSELDPVFTMPLTATRQALAEVATLDRARTAVILASIALPTDKTTELTAEVLGKAFTHAIFGGPRPTPALPHALNTQAVGLNAGLLAAAFSLGGGAYTLDAACASSLIAVHLACEEIRSGRATSAVAGGLSRPSCLYTQMGFSALHALSPEGRCRPFDSQASGLVVGEGCGVVVLKSLADAVKEHDHIYGIIRDCGLSNDIEGSLVAPSSEGQLRSLRATYADGAILPQDIDVIECHGTGTPTGDRVEFSSLCQLWGDNACAELTGPRCALTSVKSMIGHLLTGAGIASLIRVLLSLEHGQITPQVNFNTPSVPLSDSPFRIPLTLEDWPRRQPQRPRLAAVSGFGFGGTNAHMLVQEYDADLDPYFVFHPTANKSACATAATTTTATAATTATVADTAATEDTVATTATTEAATMATADTASTTATSTTSATTATTAATAASSTDGQEPEPIAIVGMGCEIGSCHGMPAFRETVLNGRTLIAARPADRWWHAEEELSSPTLAATNPSTPNSANAPGATAPGNTIPNATTPVTNALTTANTATPVAAGLPTQPGAYLDKVDIPLGKFRIPPTDIPSILPQQSLMLKVAAEAMEDAGLPLRVRRERAAAYIGIGLDLNSSNYHLRFALASKAQEWGQKLGLTPEEIAHWTASLRDAVLPALDATRTIGALGSIAASRVARELQFGGLSYAVSAEESSGLRALELACRSLQRNELDLSVVGAIDLSGGDVRQAILSYVATQANPPSTEAQQTTARPADSTAQAALVPGEGAVALVLKRLGDAQRDGNKIIGLIKGIGTCSGDAPSTPASPHTCTVAAQRACREAQINPAQISLLESNINNLPSADNRLAQGWLASIGEGKIPCALGSLAPITGNTACLAGLASVLKVAVCLQSQILPPWPGCEPRPNQKPTAQPTPAVASEPSAVAAQPLWKDSRFHILPKAGYWHRNRQDGARLAAVNTYTQDGQCSWVIMQEAPTALTPSTSANVGTGTAPSTTNAATDTASTTPSTAATNPANTPSTSADLPIKGLSPLGPDSTALFVLFGDTAEELIVEHGKLAAFISSFTSAHTSSTPAATTQPAATTSVAYTTTNTNTTADNSCIANNLSYAAAAWWQQTCPRQNKCLCLAIVGDTRENIHDKLAFSLQHLQEEPTAANDRRGFYYSPQPLAAEGGRLAFVYPGSGSHFLGMGREYGVRFPEVMHNIDRRCRRMADQFMVPYSQPYSLSWDNRSKRQAEQRLASDTHKMMFSQVTFGILVTDILRNLNLNPQSAIGYSLGESAALFSLRAWPARDEMLERMEQSDLFRQQLSGEYRAARKAWHIPADTPFTWTVAMLSAPSEAVQRELKLFPQVRLLIVNTDDECVVGGVESSIHKLAQALHVKPIIIHGVDSVHCDTLTPVADAYRNMHTLPTCTVPGIDFYSGYYARKYKLTAEAVADSIVSHGQYGFSFPKIVRQAWQDGARIFVEIGPGASCTRMIKKILNGQPHFAISASTHGQSESVSLLHLLAGTLAQGLRPNLNLVFAPQLEKLHELAVAATKKRFPMGSVSLGHIAFQPPMPTHNGHVLNLTEPTPGAALAPATGNAPASALLQAPAAQSTTSVATASIASASVATTSVASTSATTTSVASTSAATTSATTTSAATTSAATTSAEITTASKRSQASKSASSATAEPATAAPRTSANSHATRETKAAGAVTAPLLVTPNRAGASTIDPALSLPMPLFRASASIGTSSIPHGSADTQSTLFRVGRTLSLGASANRTEGVPARASHQENSNVSGAAQPFAHVQTAAHASLHAQTSAQASLHTQSSAQAATHAQTAAQASLHTQTAAQASLHTQAPVQASLHTQTPAEATAYAQTPAQAAAHAQTTIPVPSTASFETAQPQISDSSNAIRPQAATTAVASNQATTQWHESEGTMPNQENTFTNATGLDASTPMRRLLAQMSATGQATAQAHSAWLDFSSQGLQQMGALLERQNALIAQLCANPQLAELPVDPVVTPLNQTAPTPAVANATFATPAPVADATFASPITVAGATATAATATTATTATTAPAPATTATALPNSAASSLATKATSPDATLTDASSLPVGFNSSTSRSTHMLAGVLTSTTGGYVHGNKPSLAPADLKVAFTREQCLNFAVGKVADVLGQAFAEADTYPTRVRLPAEPLMLVDRILHIEGEPLSMGPGRLITEHDVIPGMWYLDGGRAPVFLIVEAGQADLFLSGYLGIDMQTHGQRVYRLLDATVSFHRGLPVPGETVRYDIRINRFVRQGDTWIFFFEYEATINGATFLTMRNGCAGFFTHKEICENRGLVLTEYDLRPKTGRKGTEVHDLVPLSSGSYDSEQVEALRQGRLVDCFGYDFAHLNLSNPTCLPSGLLRLIHRVPVCDPHGGRWGLGLVKAEADVHPDDWYLTCHFVDDMVMPGTLMYECCAHALRFLLTRFGWVGEADRIAYEPIPGVHAVLKCRGPVLQTTKTVMYQVEIKEMGYRPEPYVIADALMYADGKRVVGFQDISMQLTGTTGQELEILWVNRLSRLTQMRSTNMLPPANVASTTNGALTTNIASTTIVEGDACFSAASTKSGIPENLRPGEKPGAPNAVAVAIARAQNAAPGHRGAPVQPAIYDRESLLQYATGLPSLGFGPEFAPYDSSFIARLPRPPYQFLDRMTSVDHPFMVMRPSGWVHAQYDVPADAWYFRANRQPTMPFCVLLEIPLQACGWLSCYSGSATHNTKPLQYRNLGGTATLHREITADTGTLDIKVRMTKASEAGGLIVQSFDFWMGQGHEVFYEGETTFGFFTAQSLANQLGVRAAEKRFWLPSGPATWQEEFTPQHPLTPDDGETALAPSLCQPTKALLMVDRLEMYEGGGHAGLGFLRGTKQVDVKEWFFQAHFFQDPVIPGSLGLESFLQLLKAAALRRWPQYAESHRFECIQTSTPHTWIYRGQVIPKNTQVVVEADITAIDDGPTPTIRANGFLKVDGLTIYEMVDFGLRLVPR